jgi:hypothetical protein
VKSKGGNMTENIVDLPEKVEISKMELLNQWIAELVYPGIGIDFIQEIQGTGEPGKTTRTFCFYTDKHRYLINAISEDDKPGYLGCTVTARKRRAGENWTRGNDLPDGPFNKETWNRIIYAIVNYELIKLSKFTKPKAIPPEIA